MNFDPRTEYQDTQTAEEYDRRRFTSFSGRLFQLCERRALERVLSSVTLGSLLVDAPCGTGRLMPLYLSKGFRVLGVDISREMIHVARRRTASWKGKANFSRMDFARIPLATDSVDAVFCIRFLPHFPPEERIEMLREFSRIARERVVISLSISNGWMRFRRKLKDWLGHEKPVRNPVTIDAMRRELNLAGLREVKRLWTVPIFSEQIIVVCERDHSHSGRTG
jgi:ubiquinone/menaquinone biosynthesis C-methylase UbiE